MPNLISVSDKDDPRLAPYLSIRERDLTRGHGARFIVEGKVTLDALIRRSRFGIESLFLAEGRTEPLADLLDELAADVPVYIAPQELMDSVAGFPVHRGVLACGIKGAAMTAADLISAVAQTGPATVLVLIGLSNHDNVGSCFRNATAFGAAGVILDDQSCDPLYRKAIRVSAGSALTLPFAQSGSAEDVFGALEAAGFETWCLTPRDTAKPIGLIEKPDRLALVLGAEGPGLPDDLIERGQTVRLPMASGFDSVNVATAGAIALSHVFGRE